MLKIKNNQRGNAILLALMVCVMVAMMASTVPSLIGASDKQMRVSRVKSVMSNIENRVRRVLMDPSSYNCPLVSGAANPSTCAIDANRLLLPLQATKLAGAQQCGAMGCINPQINFSYNLGPGNTLTPTATGSLQFSGQIAYNNADVNVQPINIQIEVPVDVVNIKSINCGVMNGGLTPVFKGFDNTGMPICGAISAPDCNQPGEYLSKVDTTTLQYTCGSSNMTTPVDCSLGPVSGPHQGGANRFLSSLSWTAGVYDYLCAAPPSPFTLPASFPYTPNPCAGPAACGAPVTTTTTTTSTTTTTIPLVMAMCGAANNVIVSTTPPNTTGNLCVVGNTVNPMPTYDTTNNWYSWTCEGAASSTANCHTAANTAPVSGLCDIAATAGTHLYQPLVLCSVGAVYPNPPTFNNGAYRWEWQCLGSDGGSNVSCHADKTPDIGLCATPPASGVMPVVSPSVMPPNNLCQTGSVSSVTNPVSGPWDWTWTCGSGSNQVNCSTHKMIDGVCGSPAASYTAPTTGLCSAGDDPATAVAVLSGSGTTFEWTCGGIHGGGASPLCSSAKMIDGVCEPSENGQPLAAAPTIFCAPGTPTGFTGTGPWSWSCNGINGGVNSPVCNTLSSTTTTTVPGPTTTTLSGGPANPQSSELDCLAAGGHWILYDENPIGGGCDGDSGCYGTMVNVAPYCIIQGIRDCNVLNQVWGGAYIGLIADRYPLGWIGGSNTTPVDLTKACIIYNPSDGGGGTD